jgi:hypothetical protein
MAGGIRLTRKISRLLPVIIKCDFGLLAVGRGGGTVLIIGRIGDSDLRWG